MATGTIIKDTPVSGNGYYKMPDGTLIQWGKINISSVAIDKTWGQIYESARMTADQDFPVKFTVEPCLTAFSFTVPASFVESVTVIMKELVRTIC